jgi:GT2 family glycosyltransferase
MIMSSDHPLVYAVVLAWNQVEVTLECLTSLSKIQYSNFKIVVVDNGSSDGTYDSIQQHFPNIEVLPLAENVGLARGYNHGIEYVLDKQAEYVIAMNNDIVADPRMVSELVKAFQVHPKAGMVSPKIYNYYGDQNSIWYVGAKWQNFPPRVKMIGTNAPDGPEYQIPFTLPYVTSCCIMMSRESLKKVGLLDPQYFFYYDDWDISERYWRAGYEIWFIPTAKIWHMVSISTQKSERPEKWWFVMGRGSVPFYLKYRSRSIFIFYTLWFVLRETFKFKLFRRVLPYICGVAEGFAERKGWRP